jgi:hypothetical protein
MRSSTSPVTTVKFQGWVFMEEGERIARPKYFFYKGLGHWIWLVTPNAPTA